MGYKRPTVPHPEDVDGGYKVLILGFWEDLEPVLNKAKELGWPHPEIFVDNVGIVLVFQKPALPDPNEDSHVAFPEQVDKRPPVGYARVINETHNPKE
jgi:hypothetical protein